MPPPPPPLRSLMRHGAALVGAYTLLGLLWLLLCPRHSRWFTLVDDLQQVGGGAVAAALCYVGGRGAATTPGAAGRRRWERHDLMALLVCASMVCYTLGQALWGYFEVVVGHNRFPDWDDVAYIAAYPLLLLGFLASPARPLAAASRARILLDGLIVMGAAVTFSWYFLLGPTLHQGHVSLLGKLVMASYPIGDLVLIICVLFIGARAAEEGEYSTVRLVCGGMLVVVATDSAQGYRALHGAMLSGTAMDATLGLGYMTVGLAIGLARARAQRAAAARGEASVDAQAVLAPRDSVWKAMTPYALFPCVGVLTLYTALDRHARTYAGGVYVGAAVITTLVLVRQITAIMETRELNRRLAAAQRELEANLAALSQANLRLQSLAITDLLTDLPNHRALATLIDRELQRAEILHRGCALLFLDIDHFKAINDTYGHAVGDVALREFAALARECLRPEDALGRWGGEEFLALLASVEEREAMAVAERIRATVAARAFSVGGGLHVTCSIGVACHAGGDGEPARDRLVHVADRAMYVAKHMGRNQVRSAAEPAVMAVIASSLVHDSREEAALIGTVEALSALVDVRDSCTGERSGEVETLARAVAVKIGMSPQEARIVGLSGRLHDIGKVAVPDALLQKSGHLTGAEWELMQRHAGVGADVVARIPALRPLAPVIRGHHERWDGAGYPDGLSGESIPLGARIICAADAYCAMTSDRPYRARSTDQEALAELHRCAGQQFDPNVVEALTAVLAQRRLAGSALRLLAA